LAKEKTQLSLKTRPMRRTMRRRFKIASSCGRGSAALACLISLVQDPPASLEASLPAPPRKPRNVACKRVAKKLKVTETTSREVSHLEEGSRVLMSRVCVLTMKFPCRRCHLPSPLSRATKVTGTRWGSEDPVWFEDQWMVASLCDE
jgi:hypothetical protein